MTAWQQLARANVSGASELTLHQRGSAFVIRVNDRELMDSTSHVSERYLARLGCALCADVNAPRVLVGGLGMGFTLRAALDVLPQKAQVTVVELFEPVVEWNRTIVAHLAGEPLSDPRVTVCIVDVATLLRTTRSRFDAILLDVDNGPQALVRPGNQVLYSQAGLHTVRRVLRPGGVFALWSATHHADFAHRMERSGFLCEVHTVRSSRSAKHTIYLGRLETRAALWSKLELLIKQG